VIVGPREALLTASCLLKEINWIGDEPLSAAIASAKRVVARVRSTREPVLARLTGSPEALFVAFEQPEEGVSPGQACVLYDAEDPDRVLGGGFIATTTAAL
jgi:tRNA-specific 2-thiouridylase